MLFPCSMGFSGSNWWRYLPYIRPKFQGISQNKARNMVLTYLHIKGSWNSHWLWWWLTVCPFIDDFPIKTSIYKGFSMAMSHLPFLGADSTIDPIIFIARQAAPRIRRWPETAGCPAGYSRRWWDKCPPGRTGVRPSIPVMWVCLKMLG